MAMDRERPRGRKRRKVCTFCVDKVEHIDYKDAVKLRRFLSERSKILPRRTTGTCAMHQRQLTEASKRARQIALLPFVTDYWQKQPRGQPFGAGLSLFALGDGGRPQGPSLRLRRRRRGGCPHPPVRRVAGARRSTQPLRPGRCGQKVNCPAAALASPGAGITGVSHRA